MALQADGPGATGDHRPGAPARGRGGRSLALRLRWLVSVVVTVALLALVLPKAAGVRWGQIGGTVGRLTVPDLLLLTALWLLGIGAYTFVMTGALPGLTHRRAFQLNLAGSAVSNVLPFGGAFGTALNYAMTRSWGASAPEFSVFVVLTTIVNLVAKLALPAVALAALLASGTVTRPELTVAATAALVVLVLLVAALAVLWTSDRAAHALAHLAGRVVLHALRLLRRPRDTSPAQALLHARLTTVGVVRRHWPRLAGGMVGYAVLQAGLLTACLRLLGDIRLSPVEIFAGFALERVLSLAVLTPGGAGVVEVGMTALLVALGGAPASTAAAVLVYRAFIFGLDVPVGFAALALWTTSRRRGSRRPAAEAAA